MKTTAGVDVQVHPDRPWSGVSFQLPKDLGLTALGDPRLVGVHWFQYRDQAFTGRNDSECYQIGFVNVADAPYPEMVEAAREIARTMYVRRSSAKDVQREGK